jgi:hypothetical protein
MKPRAVTAWTLTAVVCTSLLGCNGNDVKYKPRKPPAGAKADLPAVPNVPQRPTKQGDAYTVWGASYFLRSQVHHKEVADKKISITGYVIKTNLDKAPKCAVHKTGKADPKGCVSPIPTFWIADSQNADEKDAIRVMGWASNFAQIFDAIKAYKAADKSKKDAKPVQDEQWGDTLPNPLPVKGAKVTVTGQYSTTFTKASSGEVADPIMGLMTYESIQYIQKPTEVATLPGMKD